MKVKFTLLIFSLLFAAQVWASETTLMDGIYDGGEAAAAGLKASSCAVEFPEERCGFCSKNYPKRNIGDVAQKIDEAALRSRKGGSTGAE